VFQAPGPVAFPHPAVVQDVAPFRFPLEILET
jgi:hypothetical protein